jgi:hypothetical protein
MTSACESKSQIWRAVSQLKATRPAKAMSSKRPHPSSTLSVLADQFAAVHATSFTSAPERIC